MVLAIELFALLAVVWVLCSPLMLWKVLQKKVFIFDEESKGSEDDFGRLCRTLVDKQGFQIHPLQLWGSGRLLSGYYFQHPRSNLVFNFHMGRNNSVLSCVSFIRLYSQFGSVYVIEPPGFGNTSGQADFLTFGNCGLVSHRALIQMGYLNEQIIPCGDSLGAAAAIAEATWANSRAVIVSAAFESMVRMAKEQMPILRLYPRWMFPSHTRLDNLQHLRRFEGATLLLHGLQDELVSMEHAFALKAAAPDRITLVELDARHRDAAGSDPETFETAVFGFLTIWLNADPVGKTAGAVPANDSGAMGGAGNVRAAVTAVIGSDGISTRSASGEPGSGAQIVPIRMAAAKRDGKGGRAKLTLVVNAERRPPRLATDSGAAVQRTAPRLAASDGKIVDPFDKGGSSGRR